MMQGEAKCMECGRTFTFDPATGRATCHTEPLVDVKTAGLQKVHDRFIQLSADMLCKGETPRVVLFSHNGYIRAMAEMHVNGFAGHRGMEGEPTTYGGLPFHLVQGQEADIALSDKTKEDFARRPGLGRGAVVLKAPLTGPITLEVVGRHLTAAQLCDIIRAWLDHDTCKWGQFERELDHVVTRHGRFE